MDEGELAAGVIGLAGIAVVTGDVATGPGTASKVLTPRLPISVEPKGMPTPRLEPPAIVVGVDDAAGFVAPEPHMLERPEVSIMAVVVGIAEPADASGDVAAPDIVPDVVTPGLPLVAGESPPPSYAAFEPYMLDGAAPAVVHDVAAPAGGAMVGDGLTPGEAISVAPNGIPVPPTPLPGPMPSGEVAPIVGVGAAIPVTCAMAAPLAKNATQAVMSEVLTCISDETLRGRGRPANAEREGCAAKPPSFAMQERIGAINGQAIKFAFRDGEHIEVKYRGGGGGGSNDRMWSKASPIVARISES